MDQEVEIREGPNEKYNTVLRFDFRGVLYQKVVTDSPWGFHGNLTPSRQKERHSDVNLERSMRDARQRAKGKVRNYVYANGGLNKFVTYTLNPSLVDRQSEKEIYSLMRNWLSNAVERKNFKYVLVPEKHKDGAWHFHGFVNKKHEWPYGFSQTKTIYRAKTDVFKLLSYTISYISKTQGKFGGRYYLHSQNLEEPLEVRAWTDYQSAIGTEMNLGEETKIKVQLI